jgi:hypothetical protein
LSFLASLQASAFSEWLSTSMLGFPTLIALHSVGMAVAVGLSLMISLRLNQILTGFKGEVIPRLLDIAALGFVLNLVTGLALFITRGTEYVTSAIFLLKILLVVVGVATMFWLRGRFKAGNLTTAALVADRAARRLSLVSTASWFGAVIAGRLIAYLSDIYR